MLKHINCGTQVYMDYTSNLKLISRPILTVNGITPSYVEVIGSMNLYEFFCPECGKINPDSLAETCCCGKTAVLEDLWIDRSESGIIWCKDCLEEEKQKNPMLRAVGLRTFVNYGR